ncbi:MAG: ATP-binding protein [Candidatus Muiribacteriota bacterium]
MNNQKNRFHISVNADRDNLNKIIDSVIEYYLSIFGSETIYHKLELILEEILVNICDYAYANKTGLIEINAHSDHPFFYVEIIDSGKLFNPLENEEPQTSLSIDERKIGGIGIHLVKKFSDSVQYLRKDNKNILKFSIKAGKN